MEKSIDYFLTFLLMIIDLILDRKDGKPYDAREFYTQSSHYMEWNEICDALDDWENHDVQSALCDYIKSNEYNPDICDYINSVEWK